MSCCVHGEVVCDWLKSTMEALVRNIEPTEFIKSFREGSKAFIVQRGSSGSSRYLEVAMYTVGGRRVLIMIPKGREGQG